MFEQVDEERCRNPAVRHGHFKPKAEEATEDASEACTQAHSKSRQNSFRRLDTTYALSDLPLHPNIKWKGAIFSSNGLVLVV